MTRPHNLCTNNLVYAYISYTHTIHSAIHAYTDTRDTARAIAQGLSTHSHLHFVVCVAVSPEAVSVRVANLDLEQVGRSRVGIVQTLLLKI